MRPSPYSGGGLLRLRDAAGLLFSDERRVTFIINVLLVVIIINLIDLSEGTGNMVKGDGKTADEKLKRWQNAGQKNKQTKIPRLYEDDLSTLICPMENREKNLERTGNGILWKTDVPPSQNKKGKR